MRAMVLPRLVSLDEEDGPLELVELPDPTPGPGEIRLRISACGVCHTELDEIEGRTAPSSFPRVLGHEVVGRVDRIGRGAYGFNEGDRVGVGWIHASSGATDENLDPAFEATGRDVDGGYAELMTVPARYAYPIPDVFGDAQAAPLLCAGAVGYRSLRLTGLRNGARLGLAGFGGSAHLVLQLVRHFYPESEVYVFARTVDARRFARGLGAVWAGAIEERPPVLLDAIIDTTPAWKPVVEALASLRPGGRLVINAIRKEEADKHELIALGYAEHLWLEKEIKTVANVTARDIAELLPRAAQAGLRPEIETYRLEDANRALLELKRGSVRGAKVLLINPDGPG